MSVESPHTSLPTVFVIDDDEAVRITLGRTIKMFGYQAEMFASAREFLARPRFEGPGCILLDVDMPDLNGLELQEQLVAVGSNLSIVFITGCATVAASVQAMKAGAVDFLEKPFNQPALREAVDRALLKNADVSHQKEQLAEAQALIRALSPREYQVFVHVVAGLLNKQIGGELGIAEKTVKIHRARVMHKLKASSVSDLVRLAEKGHIPLPSVDGSTSAQS